MDHVNKLERGSLKLAPLFHLNDLEKRLNKHGLVAAGNVLGVLASETQSVVCRSCNCIAFNITNRIHVNGLRDQLLVARIMARLPCLLTRMRKRTQGQNCPLIPQFQTKFLATLFTRKQSNIAANASFKNTKITKNKTTLKRKSVAYTSRKSSHTHNTPI